jgi:predicted metal-dependent hydrolase
MTPSSPLSLPLPLEVERTDPAAWQIRRSRRAHRLSARVHADGRVEIVVPQFLSSVRVRDFITRHRDWITERVARIVPQPIEPFPPSVIHLSGLDESWRVHLAGGAGPLRCREVGAQFLVITGEGDRAAMLRALQRWLGQYLRHRFAETLAVLAEQHGFEFKRLQIRRQKTRWGSCSSRGVISLNMGAAFQRPAVLQYLLLHELAHTRHMNHSHAYWRTVAACCANWRELDRELSQGWRRVPRWIFEAQS